MLKLLKLIYLDIWIPINFYISILYAQLSQLEFLTKVMVVIGLGWLYFTGHVLSHKELLLACVVLLPIAAGAGYSLVKLGVPQKGNKMGNGVNPQFMEILERLKQIEDKLKTIN